jgi:hypothetical protein
MSTGAGRSGADWQPAIAAAKTIAAAEAAMRAFIIPISSPRNDWSFSSPETGVNARPYRQSPH